MREIRIELRALRQCFLGMERLLVGVFCGELAQVMPGIARAFADMPNVQLIARSTSGQEIAHWPLERYDGIITRIGHQTNALALQQAKVPVINIFGPDRFDFPSVELDNEAIGAAAAHHLQTLQCRSFVILDHRRALGRNNACMVFSKRCKSKAEQQQVTLRSDAQILADPYGPQATTARATFEKMLRRHQKPLGLFATDYRLGLQLNNLKRELPEARHQVEIITVSDDGKHSGDSSMHLIPRGLEAMGEAAGDLLKKILRPENFPKKKAPGKPVQIAPEPVIAAIRFRCESTIVQQAVELLQDIYQQSVSIDDVSRLLGINRRQLEQAFRQDLKKSILETLLDIRIHNACLLLRSTEHTVEHIAQQVGFGSIDRFMASFKKRHGMTARQWRLQYN